MNVVPTSAQVSDNHGQVAADSGHIFQQNESGADNPDNIGCCGPHVPFVIGMFTLSGDAERLTGKPRGKDINHSRIAFGVPVTDECFDIAEDGGVMQDPVTDSGGKDSLAIIIPFDISDRPESEKHGSKYAPPRACE